MKFNKIKENYNIDIFKNHQELYQTFLSDNELDFEISLKDDEIVGYIVYKDLDISYDIYYLYVLEKHQKKGIATSLINKIFLKDLILEVNEKNIKAINLYEKLKFKKIQKKENYYEGKYDALVLIKEKENDEKNKNFR